MVTLARWRASRVRLSAGVLPSQRGTENGEEKMNALEELEQAARYRAARDQAWGVVATIANLEIRLEELRERQVKWTGTADKAHDVTLLGRVAQTARRELLQELREVVRRLEA